MNERMGKMALCFLSARRNIHMQYVPFIMKSRGSKNAKTSIFTCDRQGMLLSEEILLTEMHFLTVFHECNQKHRDKKTSSLTSFIPAYSHWTDGWEREGTRWCPCVPAVS